MGEKKRKKRRRRMWRNLLLGVGAGVLTVLIFLAVFQTKNIEVSGNNRYTEDEIRKMVEQEPTAFNTVLLTFFPHRRDFSDIPFLESLSCEMVSPSTVHVTVEEKKAVGYLEVEGQKAYFDRKGVVLECIPDRKQEDGAESGAETPSDESDSEKDGEAGNVEDETGDSSSEVLSLESIPSARVRTDEYEPDLEELPLVTGLDAAAVQAGEQIQTENPDIFQELDALVRQLDHFDLWPEQVEVSGTGELILHYGGSVQVLLGDSGYLEEKITKLSKILPMLDGLSGKLDLRDVDERNTDVVFSQETPGAEETSSQENNGAETPQEAEKSETGEDAAQQ